MTQVLTLAATGIPSTELSVLLKSVHPSPLPCETAELKIKRHTEITSARVTAIKTMAKLNREVNK